MKRLLASSFLAVFALAGCAPKSINNYADFRSHNPRSILVMPVLNNTSSLTAQDYFLSTISAPFAERGYYVFPAHMVKTILEENGLADAGLLHAANPARFGQMFGCDAVLFIQINKWESQYILLATSTNVAFHYKLASCTDGAVLWEDDEALTYSPSRSSGNPIADLITNAVLAAIEKAEPNYMPLATQANYAAAGAPGRGLPAGPYRPSDYGKDASQFPSK